MFDTSLDQLDLFFNEIYKELDVPKSLRNKALQRYQELATWLQKDSDETFKTKSSLYPQGSVLLGTPIKAIKRSDDFDVDLVYVRDLASSVTKQDLKNQVGDQLKRYIKYLEKNGASDIPTLKEKSRCWTLKYGSEFHFDILPSIPDREGNYKRNPDDGILITDKELHEWQSSNPKGYATWFRERMLQSLNEERIRLAKASSVDVESIPESDVSTPLQVAIQILKRHRDYVYEGHKDQKPSSIIINTLAALSYKNTSNLYTTLQDILREMESHIKKDDQGRPLVQNPINDKENFADRWHKDSLRENAFKQWLDKAKKEFLDLDKRGSIPQISDNLKKSLGDASVTNALSNFEKKTAKRAALSGANAAVTVNTKPHNN